MLTDRAWPKISIVTPSYNLADFLEATIKSIVLQAYPNLEYIIIDGGSTDGSIDIIKKYEKYISYWVSEKDNGMYHALQKGFERSTGEIMGWLNADDMLHPRSLFTIGQAFSEVTSLYWLQGYPTLLDETGRVVYLREPVFSKFYFYSKLYHQGSFIQQESTYWRRELWNKAGGFISRKYKYAGDFELWMRFFEYEKLYVMKALIGGFRHRRQGQLSTDNINEYLMEADCLVNKLKSNLSIKEKTFIKLIYLVKFLSSKIHAYIRKEIFSVLLKRADKPHIIAYNTFKKEFFIKK